MIFFSVKCMKFPLLSRPTRLFRPFVRRCAISGAPKFPGAFLPVCLAADLFFGNFRYFRPVFILLFPYGKRKRKNADETAGPSARYHLRF
ncbi:MAG TPA: hypothetical protein DEP61_07890 [Lachnospiraceae bacterium]|nr:hypothetical protein [Lachnospiraceae bacterium]